MLADLVPVDATVHRREMVDPWEQFWSHNPRRGSYDPSLPARMTFVRPYLNSIRDRKPEASILEPGTGRNYFWLQVARTVSHGFDLHGVDRVHLLNQVVSDSQRIRFSRMNVEALGYPDETFDVVLAIGLLEYVDPHKALREILRVLTPGGEAVLLMAHPAYDGDRSVRVEREQYERFKQLDIYDLMSTYLRESDPDRKRVEKDRLIGGIEQISGMSFEDLRSLKIYEKEPVLHILSNLGKWIDDMRIISEPGESIERMHLSRSRLERSLERKCDYPRANVSFASSGQLVAAARQSGVEEPLVEVLRENENPVQWVLAFQGRSSSRHELHKVIRAITRPGKSAKQTAFRMYLEREGRDYNQKIRFNRENVFDADVIRSAAERRQEVNRAHQQEIAKAMDLAPAGLPLLDCGAGWLEQYRPELLDSARHMRLILMDIDPQASWEALWGFDLAHRVGDTIVVASVDLSLLSDEFIGQVEHIIDSAGDFASAIEGLHELYGKCEAGECPVVRTAISLHLEQLLNGQKAGLAISTGLFTPVCEYVQAYIASLLREKEGVPKGLSNDELLTIDGNLASFIRLVAREIHNGHGLLLKSVLVPGGVVFHSRDLVKINREPFSRLQFAPTKDKNPRAIGVSELTGSMDRLSNAFLHADPADESQSVAVQAWELFRKKADGGALVWFVPWAVLNATNRGDGPPWTLGSHDWDQWWDSSFELMDTKVFAWLLHDAPIIFQSVTARLKPSDP